MNNYVGIKPGITFIAGDKLTSHREAVDESKRMEDSLRKRPLPNGEMCGYEILNSGCLAVEGKFIPFVAYAYEMNVKWGPL